MAYARIRPHFWVRVVAMPDTDVRLALYLLTSRHRRSAGLLDLPLAYICVDHSWPENLAREAIARLEAAALLVYDEGAGIAYAPTWREHDPLDNPSAALKAVRDLLDLGAGREQSRPLTAARHDLAAECQRLLAGPLPADPRMQRIRSDLARLLAELVPGADPSQLHAANTVATGCEHRVNTTGGEGEGREGKGPLPSCEPSTPPAPAAPCLVEDRLATPAQQATLRELAAERGLDLEGAAASWGYAVPVLRRDVTALMDRLKAQPRLGRDRARGGTLGARPSPAAEGSREAALQVQARLLADDIDGALQSLASITDAVERTRLRDFVRYADGVLDAMHQLDVPTGALLSQLREVWPLARQLAGQSAGARP